MWWVPQTRLARTRGCRATCLAVPQAADSTIFYLSCSVTIPFDIFAILLHRSCQYVHVQMKSVKKTKPCWKVHSLTATPVQHLPSSASASKASSRMSHPLVFHPKRLQYCPRIRTTSADEKTSTNSLWLQYLPYSSSQFDRYHNFPLLSLRFPPPPNPCPFISSHFPLPSTTF